MKNIYLSCDLGRAVAGATSTSVNNVIYLKYIAQLLTNNPWRTSYLFTDVWVTLVTYPHDVKRAISASWLFQTLR